MEDVVDVTGGKVLEYLRENSRLDLEAPDIAFNVRKSEKTVEAALLKLERRGLVTSRQNEHGRVYWYALPSAPITKAFTIDDDVQPQEENHVNQSDMNEDEVDLSELTELSKPAAAKSAKAGTKRKNDKGSRQGRDETSDSAVASSDYGTKGERSAVASSAEQDDYEDKFDSSPSAIAKVRLLELLSSERGFRVILIAAVVVVGLIGIIALIRVGNANARVEKVDAASKMFVTENKLEPYAALLEKSGAMERDIAGLKGRVDSLSTVIEKLSEQQQDQQAATKVKPRKTYRRR